MYNHRSSKKTFNVLTMVLAGFLFSCEYLDLADADYPEPLLYMSTALSIYEINTVPDLPIGTRRIVVDNSSNTLQIPLAILRSGVSSEEEVPLNYILNRDTVSYLLSNSILPLTTIEIPPSEINIPERGIMPHRETISKFAAEVNLDYLRNADPTKSYAFAVSFSSPEKINENLRTTVVLIDGRILVPNANFTHTKNGRTLSFNNISAFSSTYSWNFGDGSAPSSEKSPRHTYSAAGTYTVTLTSTGITGVTGASVRSVEITID